MDREPRVGADADGTRAYALEVVIEPEEGAWHARCPTLPGHGAATRGATRGEAPGHVREVVGGDGRRADGRGGRAGPGHPRRRPAGRLPPEPRGAREGDGRGRGRGDRAAAGAGAGVVAGVRRLAAAGMAGHVRVRGGPAGRSTRSEAIMRRIPTAALFLAAIAAAGLAVALPVLAALSGGGADPGTGPPRR